MTISGKATSIISRFPHFFNSGEGSKLYNLIEVFASILEATETDLMRVMRSHYVDTADNSGSQGFDAKQKGDLDKIFALYLEKLGGTSQLMRMNLQLSVTDIKDLSQLVAQILLRKQTDLSSYIWNKFSESTQKVIQSYNIANYQFKPENFSHSSALALKLIFAQDALTLYLRSKFDSKTLQLLESYDGAETLPENLTASLAINLNRILVDPLLHHKFTEYTIQAKLAVELQKLLPFPHLWTADVRVTLGESIRKRLSIEAQRLLYLYDQDDFLKQILALELKQLFQNSNITFYQELLDRIQAVQPTELSDSRLTQRSLVILLQATEQELVNLLAVDYLGDQPQKTYIIEPNVSLEIAQLIQRQPRADDLQRLNRKLLEIAYPAEIPPSHHLLAPKASDVQNVLTQALNDYILIDTNFYQNNQDYFAGFILSPEISNLLSHQQTGDNLQRLNRLLLEVAFPSEIEKSYAPYRERLKYVIGVLKNGASTKQGIVNIVAANLGINPNYSNSSMEPDFWERFLFKLPLNLEPALDKLIASPELRKAFAAKGITLSFSAVIAMSEIGQSWIITDTIATQVYIVRKLADEFTVHRQLIRVIEFDQKIQNIPDLAQRMHPRPQNLPNLADNKVKYTIEVENTNIILVIPSVEITISDTRPQAPQESPLPPLTNLCLINDLTGQSVQYQGTAKPDDTLSFLPDGTILLNGISATDTYSNTSRMIELPVGKSDWYIEAQLGRPEVRLDETLFDFALFEQTELSDITEEQASSYGLDVQFSFYQMTPGVFTVIIPWVIEGYSDRFAENRDHPRNEIRSLIDKVRAAGVMSLIAYEQYFTEEHDFVDRLSLLGERSPFSEEHDFVDRLRVERSPFPEIHDFVDGLSLKGKRSPFLEQQDLAENLRLERSPFQEIHQLEEYHLHIDGQQKPNYPGINHEITDSLVTSALFDYTRFDSLNTFA